MYKCIIVDDDPFSAGIIANYCNRSPELMLLKQFTEPKEALEELIREPIDLVFLDVEMPGFGGFELLDQLERRPNVVLISSKTQYAFPAFDYAVVDFLKKPVAFERFREAIGKLGRTNKMPAYVVEDTDEMFIKSDGKILRIPFGSILYLEVLDDYVKIVTDNGTHLVLSTLKQMEARLNDQFIKTHRSFIVNKKKIELLSEGKIQLGKRSIPVSKGHRAGVLRSINIH